MLHPMSINRADIVSRAADIIRRAGMDQSIWRKSPKEFRVLENRVNSMGFEDPIIVAEARNIIRVIYSAILRRSIAENPIHHTLFGKPPWEIRYGPDECQTCGCYINEYGFCCCAGAVD